MDTKYFKEIKAREQAATPGPWIYVRNLLGIFTKKVLKKNLIFSFLFYNDQEAKAIVNDADFIAAARTDIPALIAEVERLNIVLQDERKEHAEEYARLRQVYIAESENQDTEITALKRVAEEAEKQITTLTEANENLKKLYREARDSNIAYAERISTLKKALEMMATYRPLWQAR